MNNRNINTGFFKVIEPSKINFITLSTNQQIWSTDRKIISYYGDYAYYYSIGSIEAIINILRYKHQDEILNDFKIFKDLKILEKIEGYSTYEKYCLLDVSEAHLGIMYLANSSPNIYKIRKIKHNLDYLADTWREQNGKSLFFIFSLHSDKLEILLIIYDVYTMKNLKSQQNLNKLHEYENYFLIKDLSGKDVAMLHDKPIIINPEKVLLRDPKSKDLQQKLQFRYENGGIKTIDRTSEEVKKEIDELETRQMLEIIGNSNI